MGLSAHGSPIMNWQNGVNPWDSTEEEEQQLRWLGLC